ncbi:MAG TPA: pyrroline-5-carboxylate reductase [Steroidobacteraceae bacterium]|nr:pyrroline-5-carboxylate reductase [Steroidobacteraceae bacterium]
MQVPHIALVGAGNMGRALLGGLTRGGADPARLHVADPSEEQLQLARSEFGARTTTSNTIALQDAEVVIVAVKPQAMRETLGELVGAVLQRRPLIISVAAGIRIAALAAWLGGHERIVRTMPNRPALLGCGVTALYAQAALAGADRDLADVILGSVGPTVWLEREELIDVVTAVSGSGPAYFFRLIELLEEAGRGLGLPADVARTLSVETAYGAGCMAHQRGSDPATLRAQVTSRGGSTEAALKELESADLRGIVTRAVAAAARRSAELAQQSGASGSTGN